MAIAIIANQIVAALLSMSVMNSINVPPEVVPGGCLIGIGLPADGSRDHREKGHSRQRRTYAGKRKEAQARGLTSTRVMRLAMVVMSSSGSTGFAR